MKSYRINITENDITCDTAHHYSGVGNISETPNIPCPNCHKQLFPVFNLSFKDPLLSELNLWNLEKANILTCPSCALYMEPYFISYNKTNICVTGGHRDGGDIIQNIDTPYKARLIELITPDSLDDIPPHQIGGNPPRDTNPLDCPNCSNTMGFFGIVAYDDLCVPLYENNGTPVSLIIGDNDCLIIHSCKSCNILGLTWLY